MAGKEKSGPQAAEATLFEDKTYCIVPGLDATSGAVDRVMDIVKAIGAKPHFMDADEHDSYAAAISHVPLVASIALFNLAHNTQAWPELAAMAGPGFRDLTRLASGQPEMSHDIFLTNQYNIMHWLDRYISELTNLAEAIAGDDGEALFRSLVEVQMERDNFLDNPPRRDRPDVSSEVELPSAGETIMHMMAGNLWRQRASEIMKTMEDRQAARKLEERMRRRE
jgi:prephenate dehydrogenase